MIIYGTSSSHLAQENIKVTCPACQSQNSLQLYMYQRYAHVFWIPFFPIGKTSATQCSHCKSVLRRIDFPIEFKEEFMQVSAGIKTPWWTFAGAGFLAILIACGIISSLQDDAENAELIQKPKKGDIYDVKLGAGEYTLYKVDRTEGRIVFIFENEYATDNQNGLDELKEKPFTKESFPVSLRSLQTMLENNEIIDVERNE